MDNFSAFLVAGQLLKKVVAGPHWDDPEDE